MTFRMPTTFFKIALTNNTYQVRSGIFEADFADTEGKSRQTYLITIINRFNINARLGQRSLSGGFAFLYKKIEGKEDSDPHAWRISKRCQRDEYGYECPSVAIEQMFQLKFGEGYQHPLFMGMRRRMIPACLVTEMSLENPKIKNDRKVVTFSEVEHLRKDPLFAIIRKRGGHLITCHGIFIMV